MLAAKIILVAALVNLSLAAVGARHERRPRLFRLTGRGSCFRIQSSRSQMRVPCQILAFLGGAIAHTAFFVWIVYLVRH